MSFSYLLLCNVSFISDFLFIIAFEKFNYNVPSWSFPYIFYAWSFLTFLDLCTY